MRKLGLVGAALALFAATAPVHAQSYPSRPVRMVLPFGAGGVADITARIVAEALGKELGQNFVVENAPGAGGIAAARAVLSAPPDGYTLAMLTNGTAVSVPLFKALPFDPLKDFVPISSLGFFDFIFATNAGSPYASLADVLKTARAQPGKLNFGTITVGSSQNLSAELLKSSAAIQFQIVPYRGTPDIIVALLRDDVQVMIDTYAAMKAAMADKKIRAIAVTGASRSPVLPDVPTVQESGVAGYDVVSWNALFAPNGTPAPVVAALNRALRVVLADADVKRRALDLGIEARASAPEEIRARLLADIDKWAKVIERAGLPKQ